MFREIRRSVLPAIIERQYAEAKAAFDRKDGTAADRFTQVLELLGDPDLQTTANQPPLSQLRAMATDFLLLSAPVPKASLPTSPPRATQAPAARPLMLPAAPRDAAQIYGADDPSVEPPSPVRQSFAALADVFSPRPGAVEVTIDETGTVVAAITKVSVNALYDRLALATAKAWRYRPAMHEGVAAKYRITVILQLPSKH